jgi:hypothetical protein
MRLRYFLIAMFVLFLPAQAFAVAISWSEDTSNANAYAASYLVQCGTNNGGPYPLTISYAVDGVQTKISGATDPILPIIPGPGLYYCVVSATNAYGTSANSSQTSYTFTSGQFSSINGYSPSMLSIHH